MCCGPEWRPPALWKHILPSRTCTSSKIPLLQVVLCWSSFCETLLQLFKVRSPHQFVYCAVQHLSSAANRLNLQIHSLGGPKCPSSCSSALNFTALSTVYANTRPRAIMWWGLCSSPEMYSHILVWIVLVVAWNVLYVTIYTLRMFKNASEQAVKPTVASDLLSASLCYMKMIILLSLCESNQKFVFRCVLTIMTLIWGFCWLRAINPSVRLLSCEFMSVL